jgi:hypothetical protein
VSISDCDSDYAKDEIVSGRISTLGGMISNWTYKKQLTAAEYQAPSIQEAMFTQSLLQELIGKKTTLIIYEDNLEEIYLVKNMQVSERTEHIDIRHHFMRDLQARGDISIWFKRSADNTSNIMTENTTREIHERRSKRIRYGL